MRFSPEEMADLSLDVGVSLASNPSQTASTVEQCLEPLAVKDAAADQAGSPAEAANGRDVAHVGADVGQAQGGVSKGGHHGRAW